MSLSEFHPAVGAWFEGKFERPTPVQTEAWPAIRQGGHTLLAAPTGSGKTLAAFLAAIDDLVREGAVCGLPDEARVLYVSPLKALSNDIHKNLEEPLAGIRDELLRQGNPDVQIRALVRTGDTPQHERAKMRRTPPHIVVTTPESLYILLTSESGRSMLSTVRTVIVDEIHAVAGSKRGAHLALSLARLDALCSKAPVRIGLSATQKPMQAVARFLTGSDDCAIIDTGHQRRRDLALALPRSPLEAVMANEVWSELYDQLAELVQAHRTTLIFANNRRQCERVARHLAERIGEDGVTSHHGSLSRKHRLDAEVRLKAGKLRALVATSSLELGIDIGDVDLVCQLGSPRSIGALLQRVGRAGHAVNATPKGRLFPLSRDDLVECCALLDAERRGELDVLHIPERSLDVLAQQIVAEVAGREWDEAALYEQFRRAWPYRDLTREEYTAVVRMLADGYTTRRGRRGAYLHRDAVNGILRARRGARLTALTNGGVIPDQFDYEVVLLPEGFKVGTLNEDFAFESIPGDIFQLGNTSYRICKVAQGKVYAEDAKGQPPNIPFWFGEAPGRSDELSQAVSRLRTELDCRLDAGEEPASAWAREELGLDEAAVRQLIDYSATSRAALTALPSLDTIIFERFFDEAGDQHLVIHSPYGSRINRAWGLALRKRFCRAFNFELQAAADENTIVLSLGATHSFALEDITRYLNSASVREVLTQALLDAPMFGTRWRWNASVALAVKRNFNGKRAPAQFQRADAEDLLAVVFPDQLACAENLSAGYREIPDHPLVRQTVSDCLRATMDVDGLEKLLRRLESGEIRIVCRDLAAPSPMAFEILGARPYAFLDDAPAEERRTLAVRQRGVLGAEEAAALGRLDAEAIARVRKEAWPEARTADELHDALLVTGFLTAGEGESACVDFGWRHLFDELVAARRAASLTPPGGEMLWVAAERLDWLRQLWPEIETAPAIDAIPHPGVTDADAARREILRGRLEALGPVTAETLAAPLGLNAGEITAALDALQNEGFAMQGHYTGTADVEWCERGLLARIHRYTLKSLRAEIEPVTPAAYYRFLLHWQHAAGDEIEGPEALAAVLEQLEGYPAAASSWESSLLPLRIRRYDAGLLDRLCNAGRFVWTRLNPPRIGEQSDDKAGSGKHAAPVRNTPIAFVARSHVKHWRELAREAQEDRLSSNAQAVLDVLREHGALFFTDLEEASALLHSQVETALAELVARGLVTADTFAGLRALIGPQLRGADTRRLRRRARMPGVEDAGRWSVVFSSGRHANKSGPLDGEHVAHIASVLLRRYGVICRRVLEREPLLPPWRDLLYVFRRMEARGEVRGGRFVQGMSGEQFALPEAIGALREARKRKEGESIMLSAADPLNLIGIITPGQRLPALPGNRLLLKDGVPVAVRSGKQIEFLQDVEATEEWSVRRRLMGPFRAPASAVAREAF
ncbi:MAG: DEAD/DEAH box helicase [Woeseia sp.]